ncbi:MAG: ABC transporter permease [bacterium]|nr:ABC transporter permease [bacterium]
MHRFLSINKITLIFSSLGLWSLLFSGFATFRPNRLLDGEPVSLFEAAGVPSALLITGIWLLILLASLLPVPRRINGHLLSLSASSLWPLYLGAAGTYASRVASQAGSLARVSLGPATWTALFLTALLPGYIWQRGDVRDRIFLICAGLAALAAVAGLFASGHLAELSILREFSNRQDRFFGELAHHVTLSLSSVFLATAMGLPLGILAHRGKRLRTPLFFILNIFQTIPSLALFGILIPVLAALIQMWPRLTGLGIQAIGSTPALIALIAYSLLPVARNSYAGFASVDIAAVDAGRGMGMSTLQLLWRVELPIASPVILSGIRIALVQAIGLTAVAALIGAGGLGVFIFQGLGQAATDLILLGAVPIIVMAVVVDSFMNGLIELFRPRGMK